MWEQLKKYAALVIFVALLAVSLWGYLKYRSYEKTLADLRNQVAAKDKTTEELKGKYTKLVQENGDLKSSDAELQRFLNKSKQDLIAESQLTAYWKGKYSYEVGHKPLTPVSGQPTAPASPNTCTEAYATYRGQQDIGFLLLTIDTTTLDPTHKTSLTVEPGSKPLKLTLDLTRDAKQQWHTHVVSSDDRIGVDIGINSVNIEPLQGRWYEKLKLHLDIGAGDGFLAGVGATAQFGQFDLGPSAWFSTVGGGSKFYGANISWALFKSR